MPARLLTFPVLGRGGEVVCPAFRGTRRRPRRGRLRAEVRGRWARERNLLDAELFIDAAAAARSAFTLSNARYSRRAYAEPHQVLSDSHQRGRLVRARQGENRRVVRGRDCIDDSLLLTCELTSGHGELLTGKGTLSGDVCGTYTAAVVGAASICWMSTETQAVADMMSVFSRCPHLDPVFATHDKVLITDGHIEIYSSTKQSKEKWRGRVNVQIKGRARKSKKRAINSFSLTRTELQAHMGNAGLLYLHGDYPEQGKSTLLYAVLTPFKIREMLDAIPEDQKNVSIPLKRLPRLPAELERIVEVVFVGSRQNPLIRTDPALFESITHMSVSAVDDIDLTAPVFLRHEDTAFAIEATTKDGSLVPIDIALEIVPGEYLERSKVMRVTAGGAVYDRVLLQRMTPEQTRVTFDEGLSMLIHESPGSQRATLDVSYPSGFAGRKRVLEFVIGAADARTITFGDLTLSLGPFDKQDSQLEEMRRHLAFLRRLQEVFDKLDIDGELIDLSTLEDDDFHRLNVLHGILIAGASPENSTGEPARALINIGPWAVAFVVVEGQEPGTWRYIDLFDLASPQMLRWSAESNRDVTIPVTAYDVIETEHLPRVLNLRLDLIDQAYERIAQAPTTVEVANQCVRDLIDAADTGGPRSEELLSGADRLNEWLIGRQGPLDHHRLNRWQIAWRRGELTDAERAEIRTVSRAAARSHDATAVQREVACALLLEQRAEAQYLSGQLSDDERSAMQAWPIWRLYQHVVERTVTHRPAPDSDSHDSESQAGTH